MKPSKRLAAAMANVRSLFPEREPKPQPKPKKGSKFGWAEKNTATTAVPRRARKYREYADHE
jgi:hypothetical protein